jgi:hypothetical protein
LTTQEHSQTKIQPKIMQSEHEKIIKVQSYFTPNHYVAVLTIIRAKRDQGGSFSALLEGSTHKLLH